MWILKYNLKLWLQYILKNVSCLLIIFYQQSKAYCSCYFLEICYIYEQKRCLKNIFSAHIAQTSKGKNSSFWLLQTGRCAFWRILVLRYKNDLSIRLQLKLAHNWNKYFLLFSSLSRTRKKIGNIFNQAVNSNSFILSH